MSPDSVGSQAGRPSPVSSCGSPPRFPPPPLPPLPTSPLNPSEVCDNLLDLCTLNDVSPVVFATARNMMEKSGERCCTLFIITSLWMAHKFDDQDSFTLADLSKATRHAYPIDPRYAVTVEREMLYHLEFKIPYRSNIATIVQNVPYTKLYHTLLHLMMRTNMDRMLSPAHWSTLLLDTKNGMRAPALQAMASCLKARRSPKRIYGTIQKRILFKRLRM